MERRRPRRHWLAQESACVDPFTTRCRRSRSAAFPGCIPDFSSPSPPRSYFNFSFSFPSIPFPPSLPVSFYLPHSIPCSLLSRPVTEYSVGGGMGLWKVDGQDGNGEGVGVVEGRWRGRKKEVEERKFGRREGWWSRGKGGECSLDRLRSGRIAAPLKRRPARPPALRLRRCTVERSGRIAMRPCRDRENAAWTGCAPVVSRHP